MVFLVRICTAALQECFPVCAFSPGLAMSASIAPSQSLPVSSPGEGPVASPAGVHSDLPALSDVSSVEPRRVWIFFDRALFELASRLSGVELESAWCRLFVIAGRRGHVYGPSEQFSEYRIALELEVLRRGCGTRTLASGASVSQRLRLHSRTKSVVMRECF